ncbi:MAG: glycosyltransferase family 39 protein [Butyrivibrio sp.]|nr:glycosyltransferase family 39 protein [Butyrivibrio sp.]
MKNPIGRIFINIYFYIFTFAIFVISIVSLLTTITFEMYSENDLPEMKIDNIPLLIISMIALFGVLYFVKRKTKILERPGKSFVIATIMEVAFMMLLILSIHPRAVTDGLSLDRVINEFSAGDYSSLTEKGGYLFIYPFQLGYVAFGQIMHAFTGESNYFAYQILNILIIVMTVSSLYLISYECFEDVQIAALTALMGLGLTFLYVYSAYIYTDVCSLGPEIMALYFQIKFMKYDKYRDEIIAVLLIGISVLLKMNSIIAAIAMIIMIVLNISRKNKNYRLILADALMILLIILACTIPAKVVNAYYVSVSGIEKIPTGVPRTGHIAMGLQESETENGWYNAYNVNVLIDNDYDSEAADTEAKENIKERVSLFIHHPYYAFKFFARKFIMQWADPTCVSMRNLELTSRHVENQSALSDFMVYGTGKSILEWIMNVMHLLMYGGTLLYCIFSIRKKDINFYVAFLALFVCGGMAFHEIWEASGRYTMRYYVVLLPMAAAGTKEFLDITGQIVNKKRT